MISKLLNVGLVEHAEKEKRPLSTAVVKRLQKGRLVTVAPLRTILLIAPLHFNCVTNCDSQLPRVSDELSTI